MSNQIFKKEFPNKIIFNFLETYAIKDNTKYYLVTKESFKSAEFHEDIEKFCNSIEKYYYNCKKFYITRKQNYKTFITILRQICKFNHLAFTSKIKYDKVPFSALFKIKDFTDYIDNLSIAGLNEVTPAGEYWTQHDIYTIFVLNLNKSFCRKGFGIQDLGLDHHKMHASCAFYNSGFKEAICIVKDGAGSEYYFDDDNFCGREISSVFSCKYPADFEVIEKHVGFLLSLYIDANLTTQDLDRFSTEKVEIDDTISPAEVFEFTSENFGFHPLDAGKIMGMATYGKEDSSLPLIYKDGKINKNLFVNINKLFVD